MKKLTSVAIAAAFLLALSASYLVWAGPPERVKVCHVSPDQNFITDRIRLVKVEDLEEHLGHGDCLDYGAVIDEPGRPCECLCPDGTVPPCDV